MKKGRIGGLFGHKPSLSGQHVGPDVLGPTHCDFSFQLVACSGHATSALDRLNRLGGRVVLVNGGNVNDVLRIDEAVAGVHDDRLRIRLQAGQLVQDGRSRELAMLVGHVA